MPSPSGTIPRAAPLTTSWWLCTVGSQTILAPSASAASTAATLSPPDGWSVQMPPNTRRSGTASSTFLASAGEAKLCDFSTSAAWPLAAASRAASSAVTLCHSPMSRVPPMVSGPKWQCRSMASEMRKGIDPPRGRVSGAEHEALDQGDQPERLVALDCVARARHDLVPSGREPRLELVDVFVEHELRLPAAHEHDGHGDGADVVPHRSEVGPRASSRLLSLLGRDLAID